MAAPDSTQRFSDRALDYARHRPSYPDAAIFAVLAGLGDPSRLTVADIGAGTGLSSRAFAERGVQVLAVEPNAPMRKAATPHPRVHWYEGRAEATGLDSGVADVVACAQAFHWFATKETIREFHRILRPHGRLALLRNKKDLQDPFTAAYRAAMLDLVGDAPAEAFELDPALLAHGPFVPLRQTAVPHAQTLDLEGVLGRAMSGSYVPKSGPVHDELVTRLRAVHARFADSAGLVHLHLRAEVTLAERA